jgi:hypothetical protein
MQLRFVTSESAFDYFRTTLTYLEAHGKPIAFYNGRQRPPLCVTLVIYAFHGELLRESEWGRLGFDLNRNLRRSNRPSCRSLAEPRMPRLG